MKLRHQEESGQVDQNPWLLACGRFRDTSELTEEIAHELIERVLVDADNHISIKLRYQDEYLALVRLLTAEREAAFA